MALVENLGSPRKRVSRAAEKRCKVLVDARAVNSTYHGARLSEGENVLTVPESLVDDLLANVEDADWAPVMKRYEERVQKWCYPDGPDTERIREPETMPYNLSAAFVDQYMREPKPWRRVEVLERDIDPPMSDADKMAVTLIDKIAAAQSSAKPRRKSGGSTE